MSERKKRAFEQAVKWGSDREIRDAAEELNQSTSSYDRDEVVEFMADTLKQNKFGVHEFAGEVQYDGVKVRKGPFAKIEIDRPYYEADEEY
jgi:hypothetical protein